jgi:MFS family permease
VRSDRTMLSMIGLIALSTTFVFPTISVMLPLYVRNVLGLGADRLGVLMAVSAVGGISGALGLLSVARELRLKFMTGAAVMVGVSLFCFSRVSSFPLTAACMLILAVGVSFNFALAGTIVQERSPAPLRGRISAIFSLSFFGLLPITGILVTGLSDLIGMRSAMAIASVCYGIGAVLILSAAGRTVCERAKTPVPEPETAPIA